MSDKNNKEENLIKEHFEKILKKDPVINKELDAPPDVDLEVNKKNKEDDIIADEC